MAKTISICNQKGGVGKTTTAINLATYLALAGKKTLLVDIDPQSNATSGLGIEKKLIANNIYNVLLENIPIQDVIVSFRIENLFIAPSNLQLTGAEIELVGMPNREVRLKEALLPIKDSYSYVIIDCPPSLGLLTINALVASDTVLIPLQCEYYAMEGLSQLLDTIRRVREALNAGLELEGVLLTMADYRTNLTGEVIKEAKGFFKEKVYTTIIPRTVRLSEAPGFGIPMALYDKSSLGAKSYAQLAQEVLGQMKPRLMEREPSLRSGSS